MTQSPESSTAGKLQQKGKVKRFFKRNFTKEGKKEDRERKQAAAVAAREVHHEDTKSEAYRKSKSKLAREVVEPFALAGRQRRILKAMRRNDLTAADLQFVRDAAHSWGGRGAKKTAETDQVDTAHKALREIAKGKGETPEQRAEAKARTERIRQIVSIEGKGFAGDVNRDILGPLLQDTTITSEQLPQEIQKRLQKLKQDHPEHNQNQAVSGLIDTQSNLEQTATDLSEIVTQLRSVAGEPSVKLRALDAYIIQHGTGKDLYSMQRTEALLRVAGFSKFAIVAGITALSGGLATPIASYISSATIGYVTNLHRLNYEQLMYNLEQTRGKEHIKTHSKSLLNVFPGTKGYSLEGDNNKSDMRKEALKRAMVNAAFGSAVGGAIHWILENTPVGEALSEVTQAIARSGAGEAVGQAKDAVGNVAGEAVKSAKQVVSPGELTKDVHSLHDLIGKVGEGGKTQESVLNSTQAVQQAEARGNLETAGLNSSLLEKVSTFIHGQWPRITAHLPGSIENLTKGAEEKVQSAGEWLSNGDKHLNEFLSSHGRVAPDHNPLGQATKPGEVPPPVVDHGRAAFGQAAGATSPEGLQSSTHISGHTAVEQTSTTVHGRTMSDNNPLGQATKPGEVQTQPPSFVDNQRVPFGQVPNSDTYQINSPVPSQADIQNAMHEASLNAHMPSNTVENAMGGHGLTSPDNNPLGQATKPGEVFYWNQPNHVGTDLPGRHLGDLPHAADAIRGGQGGPGHYPGEQNDIQINHQREQLAQAVQQLRGGGHGPVVPDHGGASEIPANKIPTTDARIDQYQYGTGGAGNHTSATPLTSSDSRMDVTSGQAGVSATGAGGTGYHVQGDIGTLTPHGATADGTSVQMDHLGSTTQIDSSIGGSGHDASQIISTGNGETIIVNGHEYTFTGDLPKNVTLETDGRGDISLWNVADPNHPLLLATGHIDTATGNLDITSPDGKLLDVLPSSGVSAFDPSTLHGHLDTSSLEYNTDTPNQDWQHLFTPAGKVDTNGNWIDPSNHAAWDKGNWAIKLVDGHVDGSLAHGHGLIGIQTPEGRVYVDSGTVLVPNEHIPINLYDSHHNLIGQTYSDDLARYEGLTGGDKGSIANFYQENELFKNTVGTHIDANHPVAGGQGWSTADSQDRDFSNPIHPDFLKAVQAYNAAHPDNPIHLTKGIFADRLLLVNPQDGHVIASMHDFTNAHGSGNTEGYNVSQLFDQNGHLKAGIGLTAKATPVVHPPKGDWYGDLRIPPTGDILKAVAVGVLPGAALAAVRNVVPGVRDRGGRPLTIAGGGVSGATGVGAGVLMYSSIPGAGILAATNIGSYALTNLLLRRFRGTRPAVATPGIVSPAAPPPPGIPPASAAVSPTGIPGVAALGAAGGGPFPPGVPPAAPMSALSGNNARVAAQVGNGLFSRRRSPGVPPPAAVQVANYMGITPATARSPQTDVGEQLFREGVTQAKAAEVGQNVDAWIKAEKQRTGLDPTAAQIAEYTLNQLYDARIEGTLNNENNLKNGELEDVLHALGESATTDQKQNRAKIIDQIKKRKINPTRLYNMLALGKSFPSLLHEELVNDALNGMPTGVDVEAIAKVAQVVDSTTTPGKDAALAALRDKLIEDGATVKEVENLLKGEKTKDPRKYTRNMGKRVRQFRMEKQFDKEDLNQADLDAIDAVLKMGAANKKNLAAGALAAGISVEKMGRLVQEAANIKDEGERGREIAKGLRTPTYRSIVGGLDDKVLSELGTHVGGVSADISTDRDTYVDEVLQGLGTKKYSMDIFKKAVTEAEQKAEDEGVDLGDHPEYLTKALAIPEIVGLLKGANQNLIDNVAANFGNNTPRTPEGLAEAGFKEGFDASDWESLSNAGSTNEALLKLAEIRADKALVYANFTPDQRNELASKFGGRAGLTSGELIRKVTERGVTPIQFVTAVRKTMDNAVSESRLAATADEVMTLLVDDYRKGVLLKKLPTETAVNNAADLLDIKTGTTAEKRQEIEKRLGKVDPNKLWDQLSAGKDVAFIEMNQAVENTIPSGIDLPALGRYAGFTIDSAQSKDEQYQHFTEQLVREKIGKVEEVMAELKESIEKAGGDDTRAAEYAGKEIKKQRVLKRLLEAQNKNSKALAGMAEGYGLGNNLNDLPDQVIDSELSISEIEKILKASTGTEAMNATFDARMNHTLDRNLERLTVDVNGSAHALGFTGTYTAESLAKAVIGKLNRPDANLITRMGNELDRAGNESEVEAILKKYMAP